MRFIIQGSNERLTTHSGLGLVGLLLEKTEIRQKINQIKLEGMKNPLLPHSDIVYSMVGLLAQGKSDFEHIEAYRDDDFFKYALDLKSVPSCSRLRQRLDLVANLDYSWQKIILQETALLPQRVGMEPSAIQLDSGDYVPIDLDVSPFDNSNTKKEGVSRTYKGCDGYAPLFAYIGREGYGLHAELL